MGPGIPPTPVSYTHLDVYKRQLLFPLAAALLAAGVLVFVTAAGVALWRVPTTSPTIRGVKLALPGLVGVVFLGVWLALALSWGWAVPLVEMVNLHAAWGFAASVSYTHLDVYKRQGKRTCLNMVVPPSVPGLRQE